MTIILVLLVLVCLLFIILSLYLYRAVWTLMIASSVILVCVYIAVLRNGNKGTPVDTTSKQGFQNSVESDETRATQWAGLDQNQTGESHEIETLRNDTGNSVEQDEIT
ncbi:hypothetical protein E1301_Tti023365 [Triplophysa tibetana]|uniref:Uncharacterized protein n=1 Tax=Triplophysa tibetana TaxID=1572043 RepID=A0A5A9N8Y0_9TELE|nr:hypothetical protein E1301_Tti023365 [Triplophysa tibetana]